MPKHSSPLPTSGSSGEAYPGDSALEDEWLYKSMSAFSSPVPLCFGIQALLPVPLYYIVSTYAVSFTEWLRLEDLSGDHLVQCPTQSKGS